MLQPNFPKFVGFCMLRLDDSPAPQQANAGQAATSARLLHELGRTAAYNALDSIGEPIPQSIDKGSAGEPLWPNNIVGSISHTGRWACAAVASTASCLTVGLDLERIQRQVSYDIVKRVCTEHEQQYLASLPTQNERDLWLKRIFSVKECLFKALYPLCHTRFWFQDAQVTRLPQEPSEVDVKLLRNLSKQLKSGRTLPISLVESHEHVLSYTAISEL